MGCCGSRDLTSDSKPTDHTPLLGGEGNSDALHQRMSYQRYDAAVDQAREQETLKKIVLRTAEDLIDISYSTERLQQQDVIDRSNEYKELMSSIKLDPKAIRYLQGKASTLPELKKKTSSQSFKTGSSIASVSQGGVFQPPPHAILSKNSVNKDEVNFLSSAMDAIHEAIEDIEVQHVGDLVVPLPTTPVNE